MSECLTCCVTPCACAPETAHHSRFIDIPLSPWDEVIPALWVGGSERGFPGGTFGAVISVYDWHQHRGRWLPKSGVPHIVVPFFDSHEGVEEETVRYLVDQVRYWREERARTVLVRCQAGLNRSSLIVAAYMILEQGYTPRDAIGAVRAARGEDALFNGTFRTWLEDLA